jgi:hypothetical protein
VGWGAGTGFVYDGDGNAGQCLITKGLADVTAISAGLYRSMALSVTPPTLVVDRNPLGGVVVRWPTTARDWRLQENQQLGVTGWRISDQPVQDDGVNLSVTVDAPTGENFFRLVAP